MHGKADVAAAQVEPVQPVDAEQPPHTPHNTACEHMVEQGNLDSTFHATMGEEYAIVVPSATHMLQVPITQSPGVNREAQRAKTRSQDKVSHGELAGQEVSSA